jgi:hypothetical protein
MESEGGESKNEKMMMVDSIEREKKKKILGVKAKIENPQ